MDYRVLGISSGIGVSLYPFKDHVIGNIEPRAIFHTPKSEQWKSNFEMVPLLREIPMKESDPFKAMGVNVILSSPDCGSGSVLRYSVNKELGDIKENPSLLLFFRGIKRYKPDFFYFENLPGMFKSLPLEDFRKKVENYNLVVHQASVSRWGNSQVHRKRLVIIGIRKDISMDYEKIFRLPNLGQDIKTCWELYGDLEDMFPPSGNVTTLWKAIIAAGNVRESIFDVITVFSKFKCTVGECQSYWLKNKKFKRWVVEGRKFSNAPGVYRNRKNDYPATARKANRQFDHNGLMLTPRQLARVQGVPDEFKIHIDEDRLNYWINKGRAAVTKTPPMDISKWFFKKINKYYANQDISSSK